MIDFYHHLPVIKSFYEFVEIYYYFLYSYSILQPQRLIDFLYSYSFLS